MKGHVDIIVRSMNISYEISLDRQISVIRGQSASGKTEFVRQIDLYWGDASHNGVQIESKYPVRHLVDEEYWENRIRDNPGVVWVADEADACLLRKNESKLAAAIKHSDSYFILITRSAMKSLPYSINSIFELELRFEDDRPKNVAVPLKSLRYLDKPLNWMPSNVLVEGEGTDLTFFRSTLALREDKVLTCKGRGNCYKRVDKLFKAGKDEIFLIIDGAAFGCCIEDVNALLQAGYALMVVAYESFEWLLLASVCGNIPELQHTENFCDSKKWFSWERYYTSLLESRSKSDSIFPIRYDKGSKDFISWFVENYKDRAYEILRDIPKGLIE